MSVPTSAPDATNVRSEAPIRDQVTTYWCAMSNPPSVHGRCSGTWATQAGDSGPCRCKCHPSYAIDDAADLMEIVDPCPRCSKAWEHHEFPDDSVVCP